MFYNSTYQYNLCLVYSSLSSVKIVMKSCISFDLIRRYLRLYNFSPHFLPFNCYDVFVSSEPNYVLLEFCDSLTVFWMLVDFYFFLFILFLLQYAMPLDFLVILRIVHFFSNFWCYKRCFIYFSIYIAKYSRYTLTFLFSIWILYMFGFNQQKEKKYARTVLVDTVRI